MDEVDCKGAGGHLRRHLGEVHFRGEVSEV